MCTSLQLITTHFFSVSADYDYEEYDYEEEKAKKEKKEAKKKAEEDYGEHCFQLLLTNSFYVHLITTDMTHFIVSADYEEEKSSSKSKSKDYDYGKHLFFLSR